MHVQFIDCGLVPINAFASGNGSSVAAGWLGRPRPALGAHFLLQKIKSRRHLLTPWHIYLLRRVDLELPSESILVS